MARFALLLVMLTTILLDALGAQGIAGKQAAVAIIVNPKNTASDPSLGELRALFTLERQFWPDGHRVVLLLPPSGSVERQALLTRVYGTSESELRKRWVAKLFAGQIPAIPSVVPASERVAALVQQSRGAIAAVRAHEVPPGVRVLAIDGKRAGDPGYPFVIENGR
jgi:hypothetical protein